MRHPDLASGRRRPPTTAKTTRPFTSRPAASCALTLDAVTIRAAIYTRISKDLAHLGLGVARQFADCHAYAAKQGFEIVSALEDNDISASGLKRRPSYQQLQELMERGLVDVVVVYAMDRLHRNMGELVEYIELSQRTGIGIVSITGGRIDLSTADGRLQAHIFGAVAAAEREKSQERIKRKHLELAQAGAWPGRRVYGYREDSTVIESEALVIKEMCQRVLAGEGLNSIAADLNDRSIPTTRGANWRATTIIGIVKSARIAGHREHKGVISARDAWQAIIDDDTSMLLRSKLAPGRSRGTRGGPRKHLLTGLLRCSLCEHGMVRGLAGKARVPNYRCPKNQGSGACGRISISLEGAEKFITEALFAVHDAPTEVDAGGGEMAEWVAARKALDDRKLELAEQWAAGNIDRDEWIAASSAIKRRLEDLPEPRTKSPAVTITGDELREAWPGMSTPTRRALLEDVFVQVKVMPRRIVTGAKTFDPGRLVPIWRR